MRELRIFIGSSQEEEPLRQSVKFSVGFLNAHLIDKALSFRAFDYKDLLLEPIDIQKSINPYIRDSDLLVLLIGQRLGDGLQKEVETGLSHFAEGLVDNVLIFFLGIPQELAQSPASRKVLKFKRDLEKRDIAYYEISGNEEFEERLTPLIKDWMGRCSRVYAIVDSIQTRLGPRFNHSLMSAMKVYELAYTDEVIATSQRVTALPTPCPEEENAYHQYLKGEGPTDVTQEVWHFLIAHYLLRAIERDEPSVFRLKEFILPIHQHLSQMIRSCEKERRDSLLAILRRWLQERRRVYETSRNFAAFELGMTQTRSATDDLLFALRNPQELPSVRFYCATALGMLRSLRVIPELSQLFDRETDPAIQVAIGHAIIAAAS